MMIKRMRFMTRREWVVKNCTKDCISDKYSGGVLKCPRDYNFDDHNCLAVYCHPNKIEESCNKCWSQPAIIDGKYILVERCE